MNKLVLLLAGLATFAVCGCSTYFHGSAPAGADKVYVVGSKQSFGGSKSMVWLCPTKAGGECEQVELIKE